MRFHTRQHKYYCGVDLHARSIYVCILNQEGAVLVHKNLRAKPDAFLAVIAPFREDLVVAVECMFTWYWIADLCAREGLTFVLGHALYMKAIHGGKAKNDRIDSHKIAHLLRGGNVPFSYVYPEAMRATRDLLRRRNFLMRKRAELLAHIQNTNSQYNLPDIDGALRYPANREDLSERFTDDSVKKSIETDLALADAYDRNLKEVELYLTRHAKVDDPNSYQVQQQKTCRRADPRRPVAAMRPESKPPNARRPDRECVGYLYRGIYLQAPLTPSCIHRESRGSAPTGTYRDSMLAESRPAGRKRKCRIQGHSYPAQSSSIGSHLPDGGGHIAWLQAGPPGLAAGFRYQSIKFLHRRRRNGFQDHNIAFANNDELISRFQS